MTRSLAYRSGSKTSGRAQLRGSWSVPHTSSTTRVPAGTFTSPHRVSRPARAASSGTNGVVRRTSCATSIGDSVPSAKAERSAGCSSSARAPPATSQATATCGRTTLRSSVAATSSATCRPSSSRRSATARTRPEASVPCRAARTWSTTQAWVLARAARARWWRGPATAPNPSTMATRSRRSGSHPRGSTARPARSTATRVSTALARSNTSTSPSQPDTSSRQAVPRRAVEARTASASSTSTNQCLRTSWCSPSRVCTAPGPKSG